MRVLVIDNGGQWTHREWRVLRDIGVDTEIIPNTTPLAGIDADGLVMSGGAPNISFEVPKLGNSSEYLEGFDYPILGMCLSHQLIALHFGGKAGPAATPEYGKAELVVDIADDLFDGLPDRFTVWESHNDEVKEAPGFAILAHSDNCAIQAIKHKQKPIYGVQFHPEVEHTEHGEEIFQNFLKLCKK